MTDAGRVLIVEDESGLREGLASAVERLGCSSLAVPGLGEARRLLRDQSVDCILLDIRLKDGDGLDLLAELRAGPLRDVPVIMATAYGDSERTIRAMRDGAFDYVTKPFDLPALLVTVQRALEQRRMSREQRRAERPLAEGGGLVGSSAAMLVTWKLIGRAAASAAPVLVTGETGVGKELVARAIHDYSARAREPFVAVNLAALPAGLIESELFGHEKGAFTGASARRAGRFELAAGGTLLLDEIGDLEPSLQTKLLRVLHDGKFERVGGHETLDFRARVVAATHKPVHPGEPGSQLREDLYYRLAVIEIHVPPLRARRSDIPQLVAHALRAVPARAVSEAAMELLSAYHWPGNVRELMHVVERAGVLASGEIIDVPDLPEAVRNHAVAPDTDTERLSLREAVSRLERRMITDALQQTNGNRSEAARRLGIARAQLYAKLQEFGIE